MQIKIAKTQKNEPSFTHDWPDKCQSEDTYQIKKLKLSTESETLNISMNSLENGNMSSRVTNLKNFFKITFSIFVDFKNVLKLRIMPVFRIN